MKCVKTVGGDREQERAHWKEGKACVPADQDSNPEPDGAFSFLPYLTRLLGFEKIIHPTNIRGLLCARLCLALGIQ